jgi:hypothetical protein
MKPILLRAPKSPFEYATPRRSLDENLIGDNSGNLIFIHAAWKILATHGTEIEAAGMGGYPRRADEFNERNSVYVVPLANAFRLNWASHFERMTSFIEHLKIPVVVLGVGAQGGLDFDPERLKPIEPTVRRFVNAVLERGPTIGVRGETTASYLEWLGYRDVEVIGCPSLFLDGDRIGVTKRVDRIGPDSNLAINISPYIEAMGPFVMSAVARYPRLTYIAQDKVTLRQIVYGEPWREARKGDAMPNHLSHPLMRPGRVRLYVEPWPWLEDLKAYDFAFGSRIHGNIAAILAGTPSYVLAHDSRTLELARYFRIPHRPMTAVDAHTDPADLYAEADYGPLIDGHAERFARFISYLEKHGLRHVFADDEDPGAFDRQVAATSYPPAVTTPDLGGRVRRGIRMTGERLSKLRRDPGVVRRRLRTPK